MYYQLLKQATNPDFTTTFWNKIIFPNQNMYIYIKIILGFFTMRYSKLALTYILLRQHKFLSIRPFKPAVKST